MTHDACLHTYARTPSDDALFQHTFPFASHIMDFPRPPPSLNGNCNDLLRRVGDFLPKIKEANQGESLFRGRALFSFLVASHSSLQRLYVELDGSDAQQQIDATLVEDKDEDSSDDESDSQNETLSSAPTIELKVAMGKLDENPGLCALLAADKDTEGEAGTAKLSPNGTDKDEKVNRPGQCRILDNKQEAKSTNTRAIVTHDNTDTID